MSAISWWLSGRRKKTMSFSTTPISRALFLGRETQPVDLAVFWQKRQEDETYCIACELMLCFDERWIAVPGEPPVEFGIDTGTARRSLRALKGEISSLEHVDVGGV
jgi:hypothetical protein